MNIYVLIISVLRRAVDDFCCVFFNYNLDCIDFDVLTCTINNNKKFESETTTQVDKNIPATVSHIASHWLSIIIFIPYSLPLVRIQYSLTHISTSSAVFADNLTTLNLLRHIFFGVCVCVEFCFWNLIDEKNTLSIL